MIIKWTIPILWITGARFFDYFNHISLLTAEKCQEINAIRQAVERDSCYRSLYTFPVMLLTGNIAEHDQASFFQG